MIRSLNMHPRGTLDAVVGVVEVEINVLLD